MAKDTHPLLQRLRVARGVAGGTVFLRAVKSLKQKDYLRINLHTQKKNETNLGSISCRGYR